MNTFPDFKLETHFSKWEFKAKFHMTASDAESITIKELLSLASPAEREDFENMWLGYTETFGAPELRDEISKLYTLGSPNRVLCFAGASEGIFVTNNVILDKDSHAIIITPSYQSHETLPTAICEATAIPLNPDDNWSLDIDQISKAIKANTKLITINFPHNPTGTILPLDRYHALINICEKYGIYILHDEIFHGLGPTSASHLPFIADLYERGISLNVMSKAYGLPGLRIGWISCQDRTLLSKMERMKHYLSICNSGPSEKLSIIALKNRNVLLKRNCQIIDQNLPKLDAFFSKYKHLFEWRRPQASCMAFPKYNGPKNIDEFTDSLLIKSGVLLLPSSVYTSSIHPTPNDRFRIGFGRRNLGDGLNAFEEYLKNDTN